MNLDALRRQPIPSFGAPAVRGRPGQRALSRLIDCAVVLAEDSPGRLERLAARLVLRRLQRRIPWGGNL